MSRIARTLLIALTLAGAIFVPLACGDDTKTPADGGSGGTGGNDGGAGDKAGDTGGGDTGSTG